MKIKPAILLFVFLASLLQLKAQYSYKVKTGLNLGKLVMDYHNLNYKDNQRYQVGFQVGAVAELKIQKQLLGQVELLYTQKGHVDLNSYNGSGSSIKLNYLEVPLLIKWKTKQNFAFAAGPSASYLINAKYRYKNDRLNVTQAYKSIDFGANADLSYEVEKLGVGIRYTYGFNKMNRQNLEYDVESTDPQFYLLYGRNQVFQYYITYAL